MKDLLKYLKAYKIKAILAPLFKMLEAAFELLVPVVIARLIDSGIAENDKTYIWKCGLILILLTTVGYLFSITAQYFAARAAMGFGKELRLDLFKAINRFSYKDIDKTGTSTLITRMTSDVNQVVVGVNMFLRLFLRSPFIVFGAVIMAFVVDTYTARLFLIVLPLLAIVVFFITYSSIPLYRKVQDRLDRVTLLTREGLIGIRVIRAFNRQEIEKKEFDSATDDLKKAQLRVGSLSAFMNPVTFLIVNLGIAALIYTGAVRVESGLLSRGQVVALVNYMSQILVELVKLANLIITLTKALASANRISDIMNKKVSQIYPDTLSASDNNGKEAADTSKGSASVEFRNVSMSYEESGETAIDDISFKAMPGDTVGIIGGTGSGKSTLVNLIGRLYDATSGDVLINGIDVKKYPKAELRKKIGYVPQKNVLFKGSIEENLRISNENATKEDIEYALKVSQSMEFVENKEGNIQYQLTQEGKNLSGGQRQRLCIARALVRRPEILIMDDSSSALDFATESRLREALREDSSSRITFIVSQRASSIMHADIIIVLDDGKPVGIGKHEELYKSCDIYREIYHTQFSEQQ